MQACIEVLVHSPNRYCWFYLYAIENDIFWHQKVSQEHKLMTSLMLFKWKIKLSLNSFTSSFIHVTILWIFSKMIPMLPTSLCNAWSRSTSNEEKKARGKDAEHSSQLSVAQTSFSDIKFCMTSSFTERIFWRWEWLKKDS